MYKIILTTLTLLHCTGVPLGQELSEIDHQETEQNAAAQEQEESRYLCLTEKSFGFRYQDGEWRHVSFKNQQYLIRPLRNGEYWWGEAIAETMTHGIVEIGQQKPDYFCKFNGAILSCENSPGEFKFSRKTMRFLTTFTHGYWHEEEAGQEMTPSISRGSCTRI